MNNVSDIIPSLSRVFEGLENGTIQPVTASQMSNAVGKMISLLKTQVEYHRLRGEVPDVAFLNAIPTTPKVARIDGKLK